MKIKLVTTCLFSIAMTVSAAAYAAEYCQCVKYVKNRVGDQSSAGDATNMDGYLKKNGYRLVDLNYDMPKNKDVIIFRYYYRNGFDKRYGHVGLVSHAYKNSNSSISLGLISANMRTSNEYPEAGCTNVSGKMINIPKNKFSAVAVYRKY